MPVPRPSDDAARVEALRRYHILDTPPEPAYDDVTLLASHICGTPCALTTLIDKDRLWVKARVGFDLVETARDVTFCAHTILESDLLVVPDTTQDARFATNPFVVDEPRIRFYAGAPLRASDGYPLGTLCVIDRVPRDLSPRQTEVLRALARHVGGVKSTWHPLGLIRNAVIPPESRSGTLAGRSHHGRLRPTHGSCARIRHGSRCTHAAFRWRVRCLGPRAGARRARAYAPPSRWSM